MHKNIVNRFFSITGSTKTITPAPMGPNSKTSNLMYLMHTDKDSFVHLFFIYENLNKLSSLISFINLKILDNSLRRDINWIKFKKSIGLSYKDTDFSNIRITNYDQIKYFISAVTNIDDFNLGDNNLCYHSPDSYVVNDLLNNAIRYREYI